MKKIIFGVTLATLTILLTQAEACTGIKLVAKDGSLVHGRTLEFGIKVDASAAVIPRGYAFKAATPNGSGLEYTSKYGAVGAIAFGEPALLDGLNEKGLAVGTFYFPGFAGYTQINSENQSKALSPVDFPNWLLTQFATVDEVKAALQNIVIVPTVSKGWGTAPAPFHYIVFDKAGKGLVIEPIDGKLVTYDNQLGTFTNSPTFDWHMTNLRNYLNLTTFNAKPLKLNGVALAPFGQGSGMVGMPGDFTPPSRFVRAAIFSTTALPSENANEAIFQLFHILNQFDIPVGVAQSKEGDVVYTDSTQMTCARDPQSLKYYFRSYSDQGIKFVDLNKFDLNANEIKAVKISGDTISTDVSSQLN
ncbi:MAG TPA: choloylglycine hydrolase family protein [Parachlamydiaceae bacterium]|nr:choloylglycine hydrolase family protein [Parachlamydiaceae bacterium]